MYTSGELERASMALDEPMREMEMRIMKDIVRRIRDNGEITAAADWQITRLVQLGVGMAEIHAAITDALNTTDKITDKLFKDVIKQGYVRDKSLYSALNKVQIPFNDNEPLQQLIGAVTTQTNKTMHNITQSLGFAQRGADGKIHFTAMADYYQQTLDKAMLDISSGAFSYDEVLKRTVREMTDSGVRTVDYASGSSNRVNVAARRAVSTGMTQLTAQVNEQNAEKLDTEWFEVSWHSGARPSHWWGGRWFTKDQLVSICGLGDVTGLCGVNCYHSYDPVIPGLSEPTYSQEELEEMNRKEQEPVEYNGKKYTKYEATQRQRKLETTMRAQREEMALLKEGNASEDDLINCRARYMATSNEYAEFSKAMELPQQRERVFDDGLGNIMQGKTTGGSGAESPIKVPAIGSRVNDTITPAERKELLSQNPLDIFDKNGIMKSGAISGGYNDKNDPEYKLRDKSAENYYNEMRNRDRNIEIKAISNNSGFSIEDCEIIFSHVFENEHPFANGEVKRFDASYDMQQSFMRIRSNKNIQPHDITLLNHELAEAKLMKANPQMVYEEAHDIAEKQYNYAVELLEYKKSKKGE